MIEGQACHWAGHGAPGLRRHPGALRWPLCLLWMLLVAGGCVRPLPAPIPVEPITRPVSFLGDVKPILDARCVTCHSCYNAACQLKLSSFEGLDRGGSEEAVYSSSRIKHADPTRLFFDAESTAAWRTQGFYSVTESHAAPGFNDSILLQLLEAKRAQPQSQGVYRAEEDLSCPADAGEAAGFMAAHPERGMPFGFPALSPEQHAILASWVAQGAPGPTPAEQERLTTPGKRAALEIAKWETFLNRGDPKYALTARYLYEHLFLAHLHFSSAEAGEFYELVRSKTASGAPVDVIATVRPYDDPGVEHYFYRFRRIHSTPVLKTHMVFELDDERLARYRELFIEPPWLEAPHRAVLDPETSANPFLIYAQIPPRSRYQFLLDHSEYIIRTFIRGPVCRGQVALNVIQDHFWVLFLDPDADLTLERPEFLLEQASNLRLPTEVGSEGALHDTLSNEYRDRYKAFYRAKSALYDAAHPEGYDIDAIWPGERPSDAPLLTVYRHFDSASVHNGVLGGQPRTLWVIDYPQLERIYYALVAGFDVFGDVTHQVNVRRYMDYLRIEGELNFLSFLPPERRAETLEAWYIGDRAIEKVSHDAVGATRGTKVRYETDDPKRELVERVVAERILASTGIAFDPINYIPSGSETPMPASFETEEDILNGLRALTAPGTGFIRHETDSNVNLGWVRVRGYQGSDILFSMVVNRWHDNVNELFGEEKRLDPAKDTLDFLPGAIGSYPNYFFDIEAGEVPELFDLIQNFDGSPRYLAMLAELGVNRADPDFWQAFDWFQARVLADDPLNGGLPDLNRYYRLAK